jgi:hypothetical protein
MLMSCDSGWVMASLKLALAAHFYVANKEQSGGTNVAATAETGRFADVRCLSKVNERPEIYCEHH